ncbi:MAG: hypothetical protein ACXWC5_22350 [Burkholderiales bacterium]
MADMITLTAQPLRLTAIARQALIYFVDVGAYDLLDLNIVATVEGTATNATIKLVTGLQIQTEDGWYYPTAQFSSISGSAVQSASASLTGTFQRFVRWDLTSLGGATAITFFIRGMARHYA